MVWIETLRSTLELKQASTSTKNPAYPDTLYVDSEAPDRGLETCAKGARSGQGRKAIVSFACSLNRPIEWRAAQLGQDRIGRLIQDFGLTMPAAASADQATPPSTAAVRGLVTASPQRVHQMAGVVLAALLDKGGKPVKLPTLVRTYDFTSRDAALAFGRDKSTDVVPNKLIRRDSHAMLKTLLQAPLCYTAGGQSHGTLKGLAGWCAERRADLRLHFAKTGTHTTSDPNESVDAWITGGLQFANGAAYSYVVLVGTGSTAEPFARNLHAAQVGVPLAAALLEDLQGHAKRNPNIALLPPKPAPAPTAVAATPGAPAANVQAGGVPAAVAAKRPAASRLDATDLFRRQQINAN